MYKVIEGTIYFKNQKESAQKIGISQYTLCRILKGKPTKKTTAECIVKEFNKRKRLEECFEKI